MARPRTPTAKLELVGAMKNRPGRYADRENEPVPTGDIGEPPKHFRRKALKDAWAELVEISPPGVLTSADRVYLEIICTLLVEYRKDPANFLGAKYSRLEAMLGKLGLNPSDRSRVSGLKPQKKNSFDDF